MCSKMTQNSTYLHQFKWHAVFTDSFQPVFFFFLSLFRSLEVCIIVQLTAFLQQIAVVTRRLLFCSTCKLLLPPRAERASLFDTSALLSLLICKPETETKDAWKVQMLLLGFWNWIPLLKIDLIHETNKQKNCHGLHFRCIF